MRYGKEVHKAAEDFIRDGIPVPEKYAFMRELLEPVRKITGQHLCELLCSEHRSRCVSHGIRKCDRYLGDRRDPSDLRASRCIDS